jgi:site-specific recombinase XerC
MSKRNIPGVQDTDEQARHLAVMSSSTTLQRRNLAMVRLMLGLGLRSQEVVDLRQKDGVS